MTLDVLTDTVPEIRLRSYPKVWSVGHRAVAGLFDAPVVVQEKVDGSQISFAKFNDRLYVRSKGAMLVDGARSVENLVVDGMFQDGVRAIAQRFLAMREGVVYRGEYLRKPKHNTLAYERVPQGHIVLFDAQDGNGNWATHDELIDEAQELELDFIPLLLVDVIADLGELLALLERDSFLGGQKVEGVVVKRHDLLTPFGDPAFAKYVSEAFKEKHSKDWKARNPNKRDVIENIIMMYGTQARWRKAVQHLEERGHLQREPRDIGALMKECTTDFEEECADEIRDLLWNHFRKDILRGVVRGLPEWYKADLAADAFDVEDPNFSRAEVGDCSVDGG